MAKLRKVYPKPTITEVKFDDRSLVAFHVCKKQTQLEQDSISCCNIMPFLEPNMRVADPS